MVISFDIDGNTGWASPFHNDRTIQYVPLPGLNRRKAVCGCFASKVAQDLPCAIRRSGVPAVFESYHS